MKLVMEVKNGELSLNPELEGAVTVLPLTSLSNHPGRNLPESCQDSVRQFSGLCNRMAFLIPNLGEAQDLFTTFTLA